MEKGKKKDNKNPDGVTKLKILDFIKEKSLDTRELRIKLKRSPNFGKDVGSYDKSVFDDHIDDLKQMGLIDTVSQSKGLPHLLRIKDVDYEDIKRLYELYKGNKTEFLSSNYIQSQIDEKLLEGFVNFITKENVDLKETQLFFALTDEENEDLTNKKNLLGNKRNNMVNIVFPYCEMKSILTILKMSPSAIEIIMKPEKYADKLKLIIRYNRDQFYHRVENILISMIDNRKKNGIDDLNEEKFNEEFKERADVMFNKPTEKKSPMFQLLESMFIKDVFDDIWVRNFKIEDVFAKFFVDEDTLNNLGKVESEKLFIPIKWGKDTFRI